MTGGRALFLSVALALAFAPAAAEAAPKSEKAATDVRARELFQKGDAFYAEGRYEEARAAFQEAYDLSNRAQLLFNISNALERLGRLNDAIDALEKYLQSGKAKDKDVVQKRLANLKKRVEDQKKADEEEKKKAADAAAAAAATKPEPATPPAQPPPPPPPPPPKTAILPYVVLGAGGLALVTGGVFGFLTMSARSDVEAGCRDGASGRLCNSDAQSAIDRDKTFGLVTDIALAGGIVLAAVGVVMILTGHKEPVVHVGQF